MKSAKQQRTNKYFEEKIDGEKEDRKKRAAGLMDIDHVQDHAMLYYK